MSFNYGINRLLDLQETNFQVFDMDVKEDKITYTIKHREPLQYICKHCHHVHDSYHDKDWIYIQDLPLGNRNGLAPKKWTRDYAAVNCLASYSVGV